MINGYAIHGMGDEAFSLFHKMQQVEGIKPDVVVYTSLLSVCSHSGLVEDGLRYFRSMQNEYGIEPSIKHYVCLVDRLGTAGQFDLALKTIQEMPVQIQAQVWAPLLSACRKHSNIELGKLVARKLINLSPLSTDNYVLMANLYTSVGKWKEAAIVRGLINDKQLVKEAVWSQVEMDFGNSVIVY
ncbi:hypothetical protein Patl1_11056 [Pistacia atlantica]|uniref:Uncharacterized protein n=1 Tax=Pistacia atlantica TaxID=434234 RepID=A0ACC1A494_9ROSI|nr:hypothetical protein Patl1_11056 [Pistacia atlantica]